MGRLKPAATWSPRDAGYNAETDQGRGGQGKQDGPGVEGEARFGGGWCVLGAHFGSFLSF